MSKVLHTYLHIETHTRTHFFKVQESGQVGHFSQVAPYASGRLHEHAPHTHSPRPLHSSSLLAMQVSVLVEQLQLSPDQPGWHWQKPHTQSPWPAYIKTKTKHEICGILIIIITTFDQAWTTITSERNFFFWLELPITWRCPVDHTLSYYFSTKMNLLKKKLDHEN